MFYNINRTTFLGNEPFKFKKCKIHYAFDFSVCGTLWLWTINLVYFMCLRSFKGVKRSCHVFAIFTPILWGQDLNPSMLQYFQRSIMTLFLLFVVLLSYFIGSCFWKVAKEAEKMPSFMLNEFSAYINYDY